MTELEDVLNGRQNSLQEDLGRIFNSANETIESIRVAYDFLRVAIQKAEIDSQDIPQLLDVYSIRSNWSELYHSAQVNNAAQLIPDAFGEILQTYQDSAGEAQEIPLNMAPESQKFFAFMYHQLFVSLVATTEAYITDVMLLIFLANPKKLGDKTIEKSANQKYSLFKSRCFILQVIFPSRPGKKFKDLQGSEDVDSIDKRVREIIQDNVYERTHKQINLLKRALSVENDSNFLMPHWSDYSEMHVRRNAGVHSSWKGREIYNQKIQELQTYYQSGNIPYFRDDRLNFDAVDTDFLGFDAEYFCRSYRLVYELINSIKYQCELMLDQAEK